VCVVSSRIDSVAPYLDRYRVNKLPRVTYLLDFVLEVVEDSRHRFD
jgi:hypothetical protein